MNEPDEVKLGNCCPDEIVDPHLPERPDVVRIAKAAFRRVFPATPDRDPFGDRLSVVQEPPPAKLPIKWTGRIKVEKYHGDDTTGAPYEVIESAPNLLLDDGIEFLLDRIIGTSGTSFSNANARVCVGNGTTAPDANDTDLAGASKLRKAMDATFPSRAAQTLTFKSTFATTDANFAWAEWGVANSASGALLLNRSVQAFGTKTSSDTWVATVTCQMSG